MNDLEYVKTKVKQSGSSFYLPMLFLPPAKKNAMFAIYAFCREVDDIVDEAENIATAKKQIDEWKTEIKQLFSNNKPTNSITRVLLKYKDEFHLKHKYFDEILAGMGMDLPLENNEITKYDMLRFKQYCYRVASCVGLLSVDVFGGGNINQDIENFAIELGHALQITNIIRDIEEDANINRIYIPTEILEKYNAENLTPLELVNYANLPDIKADLGKMASKHFNNAWALFPYDRKREFYPAWLMGRIYQGYLTKMKSEDWKSNGCKMNIFEKLKYVVQK